MAITRFSAFVRSSLSTVSKHKIVTGVVVFAIIGGGYYFFISKKATTIVTFQNIQVIRKSIVTKVSGTGTITPTNTVTLKAKGSGDLRTVSVKAGAIVKQGAMLMSLDATTAYQKVATAKVNLETAELELDKIKKPADNLSVLQLNNQIASAEQKIKDQDTVVANAHTALLNVSFEAAPDTQTTSQTAPIITGSYMGTNEGQIKLTTYMSGDGLRFNNSSTIRYYRPLC